MKQGTWDKLQEVTKETVVGYITEAKTIVAGINTQKLNNTNTDAYPTYFGAQSWDLIEVRIRCSYQEDEPKKS